MTRCFFIYIYVTIDVDGHKWYCTELETRLEDRIEMKIEVKVSLVFVGVCLFAACIGWLVGKEKYAAIFSLVAAAGLVLACKLALWRERKMVPFERGSRGEFFVFWLLMERVAWRLVSLPVVFLIGYATFGVWSGVRGLIIVSVLWIWNTCDLFRYFRNLRRRSYSH